MRRVLSPHGCLSVASSSSIGMKKEETLGAKAIQMSDDILLQKKNAFGHTKCVDQQPHKRL